jgi:hypothetical protein
MRRSGLLRKMPFNSNGEYELSVKRSSYRTSDSNLIYKLLSYASISELLMRASIYLERMDCVVLWHNGILKNM